MPIQKSNPSFSFLIAKSVVLITALFMSTSTTSLAATTTAKQKTISSTANSVKLPGTALNTATAKTAPTPIIDGSISASDALCSFPYINYNQCISDCKDNRSTCRDISDDLVENATDDLDNESERIAGLIADCVEECEEGYVVVVECDGFWDCLFNGGGDTYAFHNLECDNDCTEKYQSDLDQLEDDYAELEEAAETLDEMCNNIYENCVENCACDYLTKACPDPKTGEIPECGNTETPVVKKPALIDFVGKNKFKIPSRTQKPLNNYKLNEVLKKEWLQNYKVIRGTESIPQTPILKK